MNKYSLLIVVVSLFGTASAFAQTNQEKEPGEKDKQETVATEEKSGAQIKSVPATKNKKAKPAKVSSGKPSDARSGGSRPARNPRPANRPVRPGNGRN